jgi:hypothetical protein
MIKKSIFEEDLVNGMYKNLRKYASTNDDVSTAIDYINCAADIFENIGMISTADKIIDVLEKMTEEDTWEDELSGSPIPLTTPESYVLVEQMLKDSNFSVADNIHTKNKVETLFTLFFGKTLYLA